MPTPRHWKPLQRASVRPISERQISDTMRLVPQITTREQAIASLTDEIEDCEYWLNDIYQVQVRRHGSTAHINIRRRDGKPILRDWRHFQQIKNEVVGEECEAVELYPAESRLVDSSNKYHLWASTDPAFRFPFGFYQRDVSDASGTSAGHRQRKF